MRRSELKRSPMPSRKSRIRSVNPEKKAKRQARRPKVTPAMRKAVLERDGHQCTYLVEVGREWRRTDWKMRCPNTETLEVHHIDYKHGDDIAYLRTLCRYHHHQIESQLRPWNFR